MSLELVNKGSFLLDLVYTVVPLFLLGGVMFLYRVYYIEQVTINLKQNRRKKLLHYRTVAIPCMIMMWVVLFVGTFRMVSSYDTKNWKVMFTDESLNFREGTVGFEDVNFEELVAIRDSFSRANKDVRVEKFSITIRLDGSIEMIYLSLVDITNNESIIISSFQGGFNLQLNQAFEQQDNTLLMNADEMAVLLNNLKFSSLHVDEDADYITLFLDTDYLRMADPIYGLDKEGKLTLLEESNAGLYIINVSFKYDDLDKKHASGINYWHYLIIDW